MKIESYQQFAIVQGDTAQALTEQLNEKMAELRSKNPSVTFEGLIARISYTETVKREETIADAYQEKGIALECGDCPYFNPSKNADGSVDRRTKRGECPFADYGVTFVNSAACDELFEKINKREVWLCLGK